MTDLSAVRQKIEIPFLYSAGPAVTRFLEGLKQKTILASVCEGCGHRYVPPLSFCGRCWAPIGKFASLSGQGTLESFTKVAERAGEKTQETFGLVALDGADSNLAHWVAGNETPLRLGCRMEVVWSEERAGSILDIAHFAVARVESSVPRPPSL